MLRLRFLYTIVVVVIYKKINIYDMAQVKDENKCINIKRIYEMKIKMENLVRWSGEVVAGGCFSYRIYLYILWFYFHIHTHYRF